MKGKWLAPCAFALSIGVGCQRPEVNAPPPLEGRPLRIQVLMLESRPDQQVVERRFSEALRDRLADRARILPEDAVVDPAELKLEVRVEANKARGDVVKDAAAEAFVSSMVVAGDGVAHSAKTPEELAVGAVLVMAVGTVAATGSEVRGIYHNVRLGYKPHHLICRVFVMNADGKSARECFSLGPWDVVKAMHPMREEQLKDPLALEKEEAEALARVVADRLASLGWEKRG
jgi:hypothetical protein